jgi:sporulation integral membrane protein YlbJ
MNIIFFILIVSSFALPVFIKNRNLTIKMLLFLLIILIVKYPEICVNASINGLNLWIYAVIPSLLPFFIINDMLISLKVPDSFAKMFAPVSKLMFRTSGYGAYVFIMSIFSGYPAGAKITASLIENNKISANEGQQILTFSSTSGPLFIIGVVGATMMKSPTAGYILISAHILGAVANGIIFSFIFGRKNIYNQKFIPIKPFNKTSSEILSSAIINSLYTCGFIGGYIIIFSVIISLLNKIDFFQIIASLLHSIFLIPLQFSKLISSFIEASLEISNGSKILSDLTVSVDLKLILLSFIISFSGLSIIGQVASVINKTKIKISIYVISKFSHGVLSAFFCYLSLKFDLFGLSSVLTNSKVTGTCSSTIGITLSKSYNNIYMSGYVLSIALLMIILILNLKCKKNN